MLSACQKVLARALGQDEAGLRALKVGDLFRVTAEPKIYLYQGPEGAEAETRGYLDWRLGRRPSGLSEEEPLLERVSRLRWDDNWLTPAEIKRLFRILREQSGRRHASRDRFILILWYRMGLRVSELCALRVGQVVEDEHLEVRRQVEIVGKGSKRRKIPLMADTRKLLRVFLRWKKRQGEGLDLRDPLLVSERGGRLSVRGLQYLVERWVKAAGVDRITAHGLRHSFATHLVSGGPRGVLVAQKILGHSSLSTTQKYLHLSPDDISESMEGLA
jgi:site-specific recombinase XerD